MGGSEREIEGRARNQMMQNLFGEQSEEEEEEEEEEEDEEADPEREHENDPDDIDSDADSRRRPHQPHPSAYRSPEGEGEAEVDMEEEGEGEMEGEGESEGQGEAEVESEGEVRGDDVDLGESDVEKAQSSPEREHGVKIMSSGAGDVESEEDGHVRRTVTNRRKEVVASESEGSRENSIGDRDLEDEDVNNIRKPRSMGQADHEAIHDAFGGSDEDDDEPIPYKSKHHREQEPHMSPLEEDDGAYEKELGPEDIVQDEDQHYESEFEERKLNAKPVGPPLEIVVPPHPPPGRPDKMNVIKVSNIMGMDQNPFNPKTYEEEEVFVMDESGGRKKIRLEENVVRWRATRNRDGKTSYESNARFVKWKDGSIQLLIGNEVLDISVNESDHDHAHLFLRHGKGLLQSQGRLLQKMRFMPSSLSSKSHRLLTALVDSRHKKVHRVKNHITEIDPEREKEERERMEGQNIRANVLLQRKREKVKGKYTQSGGKRKLTETYLEDRFDEDDDDYHGGQRRRQSYEDNWEAEAQAERRIMNAKKSNMNKSLPRKSSVSTTRTKKRHADDFIVSGGEESEYETDGEDIEFSPRRRENDLDQEDEYEDEDDEDDVGGGQSMSDEEMEEPKRKMKGKGTTSSRRVEVDSDEDSPPRKLPAHRRMAVLSDSDDE